MSTLNHNFELLGFGVVGIVAVTWLGTLLNWRAPEWRVLT